MNILCIFLLKHKKNHKKIKIKKNKTKNHNDLESLSTNVRLLPSTAEFAMIQKKN